jgi:hypothetical protein
MITELSAREMGVDFGYGLSAPMVFKSIAENIAPYSGLRYPDLKDETLPVQVKHAVAGPIDISARLTALSERVSRMENGRLNFDQPQIGHKLHRLTTMTSKTPQFHLLAHGNPKPPNLLVSPLIQFNADGTPREAGMAEAAAVGAQDRALIGVNKK